LAQFAAEQYYNQLVGKGEQIIHLLNNLCARASASIFANASANARRQRQR
jgi:hypothetical protein